MNLERKILILQREIKYYETVYPGCDKLKRLKEELKKIMNTKNVDLLKGL